MESSQEKIHARTNEEEDLLIKSNKKIRIGRRMPELQPPPTGNEMGLDKTIQFSTPVSASYREKLKGESTGITQEEAEDWISGDDEEEDHAEKMDSECSLILLSKEEKARIRRPWKRTLIIKLLRRMIGFNMLYKKINELWRPKDLVE